MTPRVALFPVLAWLVVAGLAQPAFAVFYDVSIGAGDVSFSPPELILGTPTRIYATVSNHGERDVEGVVRFYDNDILIGAKFFSVRANIRPEDTWVRWTPQRYGAHTIRVDVDNDDAFIDATPGNNSIRTAIFIDRDTDGDSVPDEQDDDRDNDTLLNAEEMRRGTDPLRRDTDGDGVDDPKDAFPLDARRSVVPPPAPTSTSRIALRTTMSTTPTPVRRPLASSAPVREPITAASVVPAPSLPTLTPVTGTSVPLDAVVVSSTSILVAATETAPMPEEPAAIEPPTSSSNNNNSPLGRALAAAAVVSALTAGAFVWLGLRR